MKIGIFLKLQRELKGLSQSEVSKLTGMSISNVSKIETGRLNGTFEMVNKLLKCYGLESAEQSIEKIYRQKELVNLLTDMDNNGSETVSISLILNKLNKDFCQCPFVMIIRDADTDIPYCFECSKEVK